MIKRMIDFMGAYFGLLVLSPIFILVAILIKLTSEGPVFYMARRVGKDKKIFLMYKFRTMVTNADKIGGPTTSDNDPRVTSIGKFIRKFKIDEFAQFINVLKGEMSLVGPRPEVVSEVENYSADFDVIFSVKPGITDLASIEFRNEGEIISNSGMSDAHEAYIKLIQPKKLMLQKKYAENNTVFTDLKIIFNTVLKILS